MRDNVIVLLRGACWLLPLGLLAVPAPSHAAELVELTGSASGISSDEWTITGLDSVLELTDAGLKGEVHIERIAFPETGQAFEDIRVACASITLTTHGVQCPQATFTATLPAIGRQTIRGSFNYDRYAGTADVELLDIAFASGRVRCSITASDAGIDVRYTGTRLRLADLLDLAKTYSDAFAEFSADGLADVAGTFSTSPESPPRINLVADLGDVALSNDAGTIAADGVAGRLSLDIALAPDTTGLTLGFESAQGEAYVEPVYANFSESAFSLHARDVETADFSAFSIPWLHVQQDGLLDMEGSAMLRFPADALATPGITAELELRQSSIDNLYTNLVKVAAAGTILGNLETDGTLSGSVHIADNALRLVDVTLDDANLDDRGRRFSIYGVNGNIDWSAAGDIHPGASRLSWASATVYDIGVGGGTVHLQLGDNDFELLAPLRLPMLGGALLIRQLALDDFGGEAATGSLDAELDPVQLGQLTGSFGWPAFSGTLSGRLPLLQLAEDTITVGGTLSARAFDGTVEVSNLRIEQPFGLVPRLYCDISIRDLDLQHVTETFSFGLIQGRLSGDVTGLIMEKWRPVAMDMAFYTPANDKSQHRISQRAVENLASVGGGGATAILSTGFLKFFEVFAYDRIGLRCVLEDGVCTMSGVAPARSGPLGREYYLVKGKGVPRIDVVGIRESVSWPRLVQQLAAITRGGTPTVN